MDIEFKKMVFDEKKGLLLKFQTSRVSHIDREHIICLKRPVVNKEKIRENVLSMFKDDIVAGLFSDEVKSKAEEKIQHNIMMEQDRIDKLPHPVIFEGGLYQLTHKGGDTQFEFYINKDTAKYIIDTGILIASMIFTLEFKPTYINAEDEYTQIKKFIDEFVEKNKDAKSFIDISRYKIGK